MFTCCWCGSKDADSGNRREAVATERSQRAAQNKRQWSQQIVVAMISYCSGVLEQKLDQLHEQQPALSALKRALKFALMPNETMLLIYTVYAAFKAGNVPVSPIQRATLQIRDREHQHSKRRSSALWSVDYIPKPFTFGCGSKPQMGTLLKPPDDMLAGPTEYTLMFANCRPKTKVKPVHDWEIKPDRKPVFRAHWALKCLLSHVRELLCKLVRISEEVTCFRSQVCMMNWLLSLICIG